MVVCATPRSKDYIRKHYLKLYFIYLFASCEYLISDNMYAFVTSLIKSSSISEIFLFGGKRHVMSAT